MTQGPLGGEPDFRFDPDHRRLLERDLARGMIMRRLPWLASVRWLHVAAAVALIVLAAIAWLYFERKAEPSAAAVATVDGVPIIPADMAAEARSSGLAPEALDKDTRAALLQRIIDRRVLVAAARAQGLERDPVFLASVARAGEMLAAGAVAQHLTATSRPVTDVDARRYVAAHPYAFAQRQELTLDIVAADSAALKSSSLNTAKSINEVIAKLRALGVSFERSHRQVDTAALPPDLAAAMTSASPDTLFRLPTGDSVTIGAVVARRPAPRDPAEALATGRMAAGSAQRDAQLQRAITALRAKANIKIVS